MSAQLNNAQQQAVDKTEGPVMVIAGPGTGKTTLLSHRILNILNRTDAGPENILCLTFTDAGTIAMRNKLLSLVGNQAYRFPIYTFHALCNDIIQRHQDRLMKQDIQAVSELESRQIGRKMIDSFKKDNPLWRAKGMIYYDLDNLLRLFAIMKREDLEEEELHQTIDRYIQDLPLNEKFQYKRKYKQFNAGDPKIADIEKETRSMERLKAATSCLKQFDQLLARHQRYDFNDMILWVLQLLKENEDLLLDLQEKYQYILVDEFQDTNGSQYELLLLLASYWGNNPNLFVVGDDDQSIFRFQGASVANVFDFNERYADYLTQVVLTENYRSPQHILNAAGTLIANNHSRLPIDKKLHSALGTDGKPVQILRCHNTLHETAWVSQKIQTLIADGVKAGEIAVIYRNHSQSERLYQHLGSKLAEQQTAIHLKKRENILEIPLIQQFRNLLTFISEENHEAWSSHHRLFYILRSPFFELPFIELAKFYAWLNTQKFHEKAFALKFILEFDKAPPEVKSEFSQDFIQKLMLSGKQLESMLEDFQTCAVPELIENCFRKSGFITYVLKLETDKTRMLQAANAFFDFIKDECARNTSVTLKEILDTLILMEEEGLSLQTESVFYHSDGVHFLSAHGSKGLEFDYVFLFDCRNKQWEAKTRRGEPFGLDKLFEQDESQQLDEERRLFYVAMTRAKKELFISYPQFDLQDKELEPSQFVNELKDYAKESHDGIVESDIWISDDQMSVFSAELLLPPSTIPTELSMSSWCRRILESYRLSVTHISAYLKCSVAFFYDHFLKIPAAMNEYMSFGNAMHKSLEQYFMAYQANEYRELPQKEFLLATFESNLKREKHHFTDLTYERRFISGKDFLDDYHSTYATQWMKEVPFETEKHISQIEIEGIPVKGTIDKMILDAKASKALVIDFKTGKSDSTSRKKKLQPPKEDAGPDDDFEKRFGGDYWRQLIFYKLLIEYDPAHPYTVDQGMIDFLEPDGETFVRENRPLTHEDCQIVIQQMKTVWKGINSLEFNNGCGDCEWCTFQQAQHSD